MPGCPRHSPRRSDRDPPGAHSTSWYTARFGSPPVLDEDDQIGGFHHTVFALDGGQLFGLHTHPEGLRDAFDAAPHRAGPRVVRVPDRARARVVGSLRLDELGVKDGTASSTPSRTGSGLSFRDPDGIALELFAPPA